MVPPTASHSGNRAAGATKPHLLRTTSAAATTRREAVRENQSRRRIKLARQFPDDKPPDAIGPTTARCALEPSTVRARFALDCSSPVARGRSDSVAQPIVYVQPVVHNKIDPLDALVVLDAPINLDATVARDVLDSLVVTVSNKSVVCNDPSLVPSANAPLAMIVQFARVMLGDRAMLGNPAMLGDRAMLGNPAMLSLIHI